MLMNVKYIYCSSKANKFNHNFWTCRWVICCTFSGSIRFIYLFLSRDCKIPFNHTHPLFNQQHFFQVCQTPNTDVMSTVDLTNLFPPFLQLFKLQQLQEWLCENRVNNNESEKQSSTSVKGKSTVSDCKEFNVLLMWSYRISVTVPPWTRLK